MASTRSVTVSSLLLGSNVVVFFLLYMSVFRTILLRLRLNSMGSHMMLQLLPVGFVKSTPFLFQYFTFPEQDAR